ncbi:hypothetical protein KI387_021943, partial [Taxus chinensis]
HCEYFQFSLVYSSICAAPLMADSNAPEHQDRGLFGLLGKKKDEETHQQNQQDYGHAGGVPPPQQQQQQQHYTGGDQQGYGHVGQPVSQAHVGNVQPVPPSGTHQQQQQQHYTGGEPQGYGGVGQPVSQVHVGDVHPVPPSRFQEESKYRGEGEKNAQLNRSNSSSSGS